MQRMTDQRIQFSTSILIGLILFNGLYSIVGKNIVESHKPIGAYRVFPKTFSCIGRPAGYYADIETGCQIYHMCDGLGRQFSYSCPNTTLFQQRMLICDHWYMVNCSKAESDYAANLLIGQRDKPFVPEEENQLRTPRPDLLDRPYAPDYSGESFRKQYKNHRTISNDISDPDGTDQYFHEINPPSATQWHLPRQNSQTPLPPTSTNLVRRNDVDENVAVDLGTSYSSNYNSSSDFSAENSNSIVSTQSTTSNTASVSVTTQRPYESTVTIPYIKPPSRLYEPPFLYPIYNLNDTDDSYKNEGDSDPSISTSTQIPLPTTTATTTTIATTTTTTSTTAAPFRTTTSAPKIFTEKSNIFPGKPFTLITSTTPVIPEILSNSEHTEINSEISSYSNFESTSFKSEIEKTSDKPKIFEAQTETTVGTSTTSPSLNNPEISTPFLDLLPPAADRLLPPAPFKTKQDFVEFSTPSNSLLPPFRELIIHDVATTQGPPIYFEWKIPSDALEPPKFDPPRVEENDQSDDNITNISSTTAKTEILNTNSLFAHNPFLAPIFNKNNQQFAQSTIRTPTVRSIPKTTTNQFQKFSTRSGEAPTTTKFVNSAEISKEINIQQLQKDYLIPDFQFPLENDSRTGYEHSDHLNSFLLKIPQHHDSNKPWFGENPDCPECHPSFLIPGKCEPCVKRK